MTEKFDFEQNMRRLDDIIAAIEDGEDGLAASLALYKEGMTLAADCAEALNAVEREVVLLTKSAENIERRPFVPEDGDD